MAKKKKRRSTLRRKPTRAPKPRDRPSRREQIAQARRQKQRRQYLTTALVVVAVIAAVGLLIWLNSRPLPLVTAEADVPADAQGTGWGPPGAPVVIQDWSDFG
jgi:ferric-dicitrate binding protein FerR (iron transport regulator)